MAKFKIKYPTGGELTLNVKNGTPGVNGTNGIDGKDGKDVDSNLLAEKILLVEQAILNKEFKEVDLSQVVKLLTDINDKKDKEISIPDLSSKIDELINVIKNEKVTEVNEKDEINYTDKFDSLIKEIKKIAKNIDIILPKEKDALVEAEQTRKKQSDNRRSAK